MPFIAHRLYDRHGGWSATECCGGVVGGGGVMKCKMVVMVGGWLAVAGLGAPAVRAEGPSGSVVGWGRQVVGVDLSGPFVAVARGDAHSLGLKSDGSIVAWGDNEDGQCNVPSPNTGFVAVAGGGYHSCLLYTSPSPRDS